MKIQTHRQTAPNSSPDPNADRFPDVQLKPQKGTKSGKVEQLWRGKNMIDYVSNMEVVKGLFINKVMALRGEGVREARIEKIRV